MSNRAKNFRRRVDDEDNEGNEANGSQPPSNSSSTAAKSSAKGNASSTSTAKPKKVHQKLLSFADEEENETLISRPSSKSSSSSRLSKPSSSHKITPLKDRIAPSSSSLPSNVQPQAGQYTKEALRELQKNAKTLAGSRPPPPPPSLDPKPSAPAEPVVVLKGLVKPVLGTTKDDNISDVEEDETQKRLGSMAIGKARAENYPDQATINAIRAKRERLRQSRAAAPDFISLDAGSNHGAAEGLSDEEPEFQTRIAVFGEKIDSSKKGVFEDVDERPTHLGHQNFEEDDEDEEERRWEEEQFRKGLGKRMDDGATRVSSSVTMVQSAAPQNFSYPAAAAPSYSPVPSVSVGPPSIGVTIGGSQGFEVMPISQQAEIARKALRDNVTRLKESHGKTMMSLAQNDENLANSLTKITDLERVLSAAGEKFLFMQKLRDFVSVICDFLQHKAPYIEELEEEMQQLNRKRASAMLEKRIADYDDEMSEVEVAINAAMSIFDKQGTGSSAAAIIAASTAAEAAVIGMKNQKTLPVLDEFGRDMNLHKRNEMSRRAKARQHRKSLSDQKRIMSIGNDSCYHQIEGESSTDESDSESAAYQSSRELVLQTAKDVFSDAAEEYAQLSAVKVRFERWKKVYGPSYRDAYMSLSIPAIFSPYVRLELLQWDPLHEDVDFSSMNWHSLLFDYGVPEDGSEFGLDDADANLVPGLVEKVALPILHHDINHCWNMLSTRETKNAVSATSLIIDYVPVGSEALNELLAAIRTRLAEAVTNLVVPTWSALLIKAVPSAARLAAYRFGVAVRLIRNICLWRDILALSVLDKLALDELLTGKILPHLRTLISDVHDGIRRTERVVDALSGVWAGTNVTSRSNKLQPLVDYVLTLGKYLEKKKQASGMADAEAAGLARRLKKMLVELNDYDGARSIARTFHLKEAL